MGNHTQHRTIAAGRLTGGLIVATGLSAAVVLSAWRDPTDLGAPPVWPWLLTGLQVLALWSAGRGRWWGWLLGGSVQLPWIAYAMMTKQIGFIPGCAISASVQLYSFLSNTSQQRLLGPDRPTPGGDRLWMTRPGSVMTHQPGR